MPKKEGQSGSASPQAVQRYASGPFLQPPAYLGGQQVEPARSNFCLQYVVRHTFSMEPAIVYFLGKINTD